MNLSNLELEEIIGSRQGLLYLNRKVGPSVDVNVYSLKHEVTRYAFMEISVRVLKPLDDVLMAGSFNFDNIEMSHNNDAHHSEEDGLHDEDEGSDVDEGHSQGPEDLRSFQIDPGPSELEETLPLKKRLRLRS
ncbi:hypothetical protein RIF29_00308 [Crotalaria pallida]|uniref:Uncharacterized protein n=1 Tax=Crotalaria pallida TaxID=3830 RepID=A0AAN9P6G5_CROPI